MSGDVHSLAIFGCMWQRQGNWDGCDKVVLCICNLAHLDKTHHIWLEFQASAFDIFLSVMATWDISQLNLLHMTLRRPRTGHPVTLALRLQYFKPFTFSQIPRYTRDSCVGFIPYSLSCICSVLLCESHISSWRICCGVTKKEDNDPKGSVLFLCLTVGSALVLRPPASSILYISDICKWLTIGASHCIETIVVSVRN